MKKMTSKMFLNSLSILGVGISSTSEEEVLEFVRKSLAKGDRFWIATPNPEMVVKAKNEEWFRKLLNQASIAIPDGVGLVLASRLFYGRKGLNKRVAGVDLAQRLCQEAARRGWRVFLLGGASGVASSALAVLKSRSPGLLGKAVTGPKLEVLNGQLKTKDEKHNKMVINEIKKYKPHLLFVGFGMGKQEAWVVRFLPKLQVGGAMVVGGSFDFISGCVRRAPKLFQNLGLEWLWRLILQPWRVRRQLALLEFTFLVLKEKISGAFRVFWLNP